MKAVGDGEMVAVQAYPQTGGQFGRLRGDFQAGGEDHHVKDLFNDIALIGYIAQTQIVAVGNRGDRMNPRTDEPYPRVPGCFIVAVEILALGAHIHVENGAIQESGGVIFGHQGLFDSNHAAYR